MSFGPHGYVLPRSDGDSVWFLDTLMTVKAGGAQTGGAFTLLQWSAPSGFSPPLHVHRHEHEAFYLLDGEILVECGGRRWTAGPRDFTLLPPRIPHSFLVTRGPVEGLQITSPAGFEQFMHELGRPVEHAGLPEPAQPDVPRIVETSERYGIDIVGPPLSLDNPIATGAQAQ